MFHQGTGAEGVDNISRTAIGTLQTLYNTQPLTCSQVTTSFNMNIVAQWEDVTTLAELFCLNLKRTRTFFRQKNQIYLENYSLYLHETIQETIIEEFYNSKNVLITLLVPSGIKDSDVNLAWPVRFEPDKA
jgi:hypothetical protein